MRGINLSPSAHRLFTAILFLAAPVLAGNLISKAQPGQKPSRALELFERAKDVSAKLALPPLMKELPLEKQPSEARYLQALQLLRPHLTWHAPYFPTTDWSRGKWGEAKWGRGFANDPWQEAHGGEMWMLKDVPAKVKTDFLKAREKWLKRQPAETKPPNERLLKPSYFWRIRNSKHVQVVRAVELLRSVSSERFLSKAQRWISEIERNNTVLTFDIPGSGRAGKNFPVVMDARNTERVSFKLYRVHCPKDLLWFMSRIGKDFIYRDHALQYKKKYRDRILEEKAIYALTQTIGIKKRQETKMPKLQLKDLVHRWQVQIADLGSLPRRYGIRWNRWRHWNDVDSRYFDDACREFSARLDKRYRPYGYQFRPSSWQFDRVAEVPGTALAKPGAYMLVAESNGQSAYVPIIVDALSLTVRRCRDGVFVLVSDTKGEKPIAGAQVYGEYMLGATVTDKQGAAFAKMLATGTRAIVAHHKDRFAIGGFGRVFDGIYQSPLERDRFRYGYWGGGMKDLIRKARKKGLVYADRHVVAAYTDRPTYRPGQPVHFKLIVRKLAKPKAAKDTTETSFRPELDAAKVLMPSITKPLSYEVLDPKGRSIQKGELTLNDFGTAAGSFSLNTESVLGGYSLRIKIADKNRIVPQVFAVKHYRRPNFEVKVSGVPVKLQKSIELDLLVNGKYYFGKPVAGGRVDVRLVQLDRWKPLVKAKSTTDKSGKAKIGLKLPKHLNQGKYFVVTSLTDDSGRIVSAQSPLEIKGDDPFAPRAGLAALPRFVRVNERVQVNLSTDKVTARRQKKTLTFPVKKRKAILKFTEPGWYQLAAGNEAAELFVYGGKEYPYSLDRDNERDGRKSKWVNISDFALEEWGRPSRCENPDQHILALFDRQHVKLGDKLRLLVFAPYKRARLLFTMEGDTVADYFVTQTSHKNGNYHVVEIPIKKRHWPNFYLQGRIVSGAGLVRWYPYGHRLRELEKLRSRDDVGYDPRWCRIDVLDASRNNGTDQLKVKVTSKRVPARKWREALDVQINVTDLNGRPRAAEVSLAAVDESIYAFGEDNVSSLSKFFSAPRDARRFHPGAWRSALGNRIEVVGAVLGQAKAIEQLAKASGAKAGRSMDILRQLREPQRRVDQRLAAKPLTQLGGELPVSQISLTRVRHDFRETAAWRPQLRTGQDGIAKTSFFLPDSLTRFRLTAVALTKKTEIGVGRAHATVAPTLAVQLFLPRFAVEKDRLQAAALVHNTTKKERICKVDWNLQNCEFDEPAKRQIVVPANATVRVTAMLKMNDTGVAKVNVVARDRELGDGEERPITVQPLGRPAEVTYNGKLAPAANGKFNLQKQIQLPQGFVATDLRLSLSPTETVQALNGLGYLIEYPYGCIEQTMSRFLPAVMVKHACRNTPVELPADVNAKLPDILERGLTRIYGFQQQDGSWGWFKGNKNSAMTVYVVYGLARCRSTGTPVSGMNLDHGCQFLIGQLSDGNLPPKLAARAWYALALADRADKKELNAWAAAALAKNLSPEANANLALACRTAKLHKLGGLFWQRVRIWQAQSAANLALKLNVQIAYGETWQNYRKTSASLLALRQGDRWRHTRETSWAIEALAGMLAHVPNKVGVRGVKVTIGGKTALTINQPRDLKKLAHALRQTAAQLSGKEALKIVMSASSNEPIYFALRATGVQRLDKIEPTGKRIKLRREVETIDGKPLRGKIKVGQIIRVRLKINLERDDRYLLIEDRRPAACEFAGDRMEGKIAHVADHVEFRDDRICAFYSVLPAGEHELIYYLRAETPGVSHLLPGCVYPMYEDTVRGETGDLRIETSSGR